MKKSIQKIVFCALIGIVPSVAASADEYIINGNFEDGTFNGWTIENGDGGNWTINDGSFDPPGPGEPLLPISGLYDAVSWQHSPDFHILTNPITLPNQIKSAILRWSDRIQNYASSFSDPNQGWRVLIKDTEGTILQEIFSTNPGDELLQLEPNLAEYDLTSLAQAHEGEEIVISFEQQEDIWYLNVTLDDVSMEIEQFNSLISGQVTIDKTDEGNDAVVVRIKDMPDLATVVQNANTPFDVTFRLETPNNACIAYERTVTVYNGNISSNFLKYHEEFTDAEIKVTCSLNNSRCKVGVYHTNIDETCLSEDMPITVTLEIADTPYVNKSIWKQKENSTLELYNYPVP